MKRIEMTCEYNLNDRPEIHLATFFQAWLLDQIDYEYADKVHQEEITPYSISTFWRGNEIIFSVSLLNEEAVDHMMPVLADDSLMCFTLTSSKQKQFIIKSKVLSTIEQKDLSQGFYSSEEEGKKFKLIFQTPTTFKTVGEYQLFPDVRLIIQSLMRQYSYFFEDTLHVDTQLLGELLDHTFISSYKLKSHYYPIHRVRIPAYIGEVTISYQGNNTLKKYLKMLMRMGEFTGIGIKTSMGMGSIIIEEIGGRG